MSYEQYTLTKEYQRAWKAACFRLRVAEALADFLPSVARAITRLDERIKRAWRRTLPCYELDDAGRSWQLVGKRRHLWHLSVWR